MRSPLGSQRVRDYAFITLLVLGSRALLVLVGAASHFGQAADGKLALSTLEHLFVRWDANWYLRIVEEGYGPPWLPLDQPGATQHAFFPAYPLLLRGIVLLTGLDAPLAGIVVSTILFAVALCLIYEYAYDLRLSREVGLATALLLCCAPHSFVFSAPYAESLFLCLLAAAMLALRRQRYAWAGTAAALLSATRPNGILFVVFAVAWSLRQLGWRPLVMPWTNPGPMLTIVLAPLGLVAYWWFCFLTTGDAFAQATSVTHGWGWDTDWPWRNLRGHLTSTSTNRFWALGSLAYFGASLLLLRMRRYEELAFCIVSFLLVWSNVLPQSLVRYALVLFPIHLALANATADRSLRLAALAAGLAAVNSVLMVAFVQHWRIAI